MKNRRKTRSVKNVRVLSLKDIANAFEVVTPQDANLSEDDNFEESLDFEESINRGTREYKIEIDWNQFDEPQIQTLIAILFQSIGYSSENWHESDRAREEGADLVIKKSKENIALAVKVKPKSRDRQQLSDLSKRTEQKKIYVYIQTPSGKFRECMSEYDGTVDFWDKKKLNDFFVNKNMGFTASLIFDSHKISQTIREAQGTLFKLRQKCLNLEKRMPKGLDSQSFKWLFRLKDSGVSLYKPNENVITLLEKPINIKKRELNEHFLKLFLEYLDILNSRLVSFLHYFELFYNRNEDLVNNSIIENDGRSHWLYLLQYKSDNSLPSLKKELKEAIDNDEILKTLRKRSPDKEEKNYWKERAKNNDVWAVMESRVRNLMIFGAGIEAIVDDIVDEYARHYEKYQPS